jgi:hypothetical protein
VSIPTPYIPRTSALTTTQGRVSAEWDRIFMQPMLETLLALSTTILSGPDADPNGVVVGSPGMLYRALGPSVTTSQLFVKESGINSDTGWVGK